MRTTVQRWGNSQGLRIPKHILKDARIKVGDAVEIRADGKRLVVEKANKPEFDLAEMVARMPKDYKPEEDYWGPPVGKEVW